MPPCNLVVIINSDRLLNPKPRLIQFINLKFIRISTKTSWLLSHYNLYLTPVIAKSKPSKLKISVLTVYIFFLFAASLVPMDRGIEGFEFLFVIKPAFQNLLHIPVYMVLAILWLQVFQPYEISASKKLAFAMVLSSFIGIMTECIQMAVPGRFPSSLDVTFNILGSFVGVALYHKLDRSRDSIVRRLVCGQGRRATVVSSQ